MDSRRVLCEITRVLGKGEEDAINIGFSMKLSRDLRESHILLN
jgi:hypothetical protein